MGAAQFDDRPTRAFVDIDHVNLDIIAAAQFLIGNLLFAHEHGFVLFIKHHSHSTRNIVGAANLSIDDFTHTMGKIFKDRIAFGFTNALEDHLFCGLGSDATEIIRLGSPP